jgi:hypothetical protein
MLYIIQNIRFLIIVLFGLWMNVLASSVGLAFPSGSHQAFVSHKEARNRLFPTEVTPVDTAPKLWETRDQMVFKNRGIAQIEQLGKEYVLTIYCDGIHRAFIHHNPKVNLKEYLGKFIQVQYIYVDVKTRSVNCIKAPCGSISERKILIQNLKEIIGSEETRIQFETQCAT